MTRRLSVRAYLALVLGYVLVLMSATLFTLDVDVSTPGYTTTSEVARQLVVRETFPLLYLAIVVWRLGWWRPVFVDDRPVQRWVWMVPVSLVLTTLLCTNYPALLGKPLGFSALLLTGCLMIGLSEEMLFRGLGVVTFRGNGYREGRVALWTTLLFALTHSASLLGGPLQVLSTFGAGWLYYLTRRVSGGLLLAALVHGLWDFGVLSAGVVADEVYGLVPTFLAVEVVLLLALFFARKRIEPRPVAAS